MKLVIVESPAKCKTIGKYLGNDYKVMASYGHIRDLAIRGKGGLGVDLENNYAPIYVNDSDKEKVIKELTKASKEAEEVILATDPDREGEAIAWHLAMVLGLPVETTRRLEFHEITEEAIQKAIDMDIPLTDGVPFEELLEQNEEYELSPEQIDDICFEFQRDSLTC